MDNLSERDRQAVELSREIITLARNSLLVRLRFMDRAIGNVRMIPDMNYGLAGSGSCIFYSPWTMILRYREDPDLVTRDLLHCILHKLFRHEITFEGIDRLRWDLAADIAVEDSISGLGRDLLRAERESGQAQVISLLRGQLAHLTAERIYSYLGSGAVSHAKIYEWSEYFAADQHDLWYGGGGSAELITGDTDLEELWKDIAKRMQTELELLSSGSGALTQNLREINRVRYDYTEFLKRFGVRSEKIRLSEEEFDNNYYTYGLELYGNIPLIEPLEYRDSRNIRDFVIAIDTSGSVRGEVVQRFVQHTHDVLSAQHSFDLRTNLYIIQCDDEVRDAALIRSSGDLERYFLDNEIRGLGQTDFRPVFEYVDGLLAEGRLTDLRGLLYFTDGMGRFPEKRPAYDTAFMIHSDSLSEVWVPDWAVKIELSTDEIMAL